VLALAHRLDRTIVIRAARDVVFSFLTESERWASWWGAGSSIDARPGGPMLIRHANGVEATGQVVEVRPPERIVFTYGFVNGTPPPGGSQVTIRLDAHPEGTLLQLTHEFAETGSRDEHVQGWRFQLSLFSNLIANTVHADAAARVDRWFGLWSDADAESRNRALDAAVSDDVQFNDRYSCVHGIEEVRAHLAAVHRFMPGTRLARAGDVRHCQGQALADWVATGKDGAAIGQGTNLFLFDAAGRIAAVTGFWG
jgi:uncharacterized protein YndB with AHSA1/START domain